MRNLRWLVIPVLLFALLGCGLANGIQQIQQAVTELPAALTNMPTAMGSMETAAAAQSTAASSSSTTGGLGLSADAAKSILQMTGQFSFTDGTVGGQTATTAKLTATGATTFPAIASGFYAELIGDPANLSQVIVVVPRTNDQTTVDQGIGVINVLFVGFMSADVQLPFFTWLTQNYSGVTVGGQQQTTIGKMQFTLKRTDTVMNLQIDPAK